EERLAIKVAITLGDVLRQDRDIFGEPVNLAARIESVTPPDQIYLSQAAWLALNKAEVQASFVNEFSLKGIAGPTKVYRVEQKHKTRIIKDQVLVYTDIAGFTRYYQSHSIEDTENLLTYLDELTTRVCKENGGIVRLVAGDGHFLTFSQVHLALTAVEELCQEWNTFVDQNGISCGLRIGIHQGDVYIFRSCAYGHDLNVTAQLTDLVSSERDKAVAVVTDKARDQVVGTGWEQRLMRIGTDEPRPVGSFLRAFLETNRAYRLVPRIPP
ncbi:MAG: adenylate/guanylate cyclase domain-containing protein, partial [Planctomycetota bacterium]